ncbi:elongin C [Gnomoniopsis sp. IMI 355080]|nr:elongin C [Gnomoniopsis sp. IMI 355080]
MAPRKYATLVSVDGMEFVVPLESCYASPMLAAGVGKNARFDEAGTQRIKLETISSMVLEKVAEYLIYWYRYKDQEDVPDMEIPVELCLEILDAAEYLQMDSKSLSSSPPLMGSRADPLKGSTR